MAERVKSHFCWQHYALVLGLVVLTSFAVQGQNKNNNVVRGVPPTERSFTVLPGGNFFQDPYQVMPLLVSTGEYCSGVRVYAWLAGPESSSQRW